MSGDDNVAVGAGALAKTRGRRNIALGKDAGALVNGVRSDNIEIGNKGLGTDSATPDRHPGHPDEGVHGRDHR